VLAARLHALDQDRFQHGARGIDRGGVAGRTSADNDDLGLGSLSHHLRPSGKLAICSQSESWLLATVRLAESMSNIMPQVTISLSQAVAR